MMNIDKLRKIMVLFCLIIFPVIVLGSSSTNYDSSSETINSGGGTTTSTNYASDVTMGEIAGNTSSASYSTGIGFQYTVAGNNAPTWTEAIPDLTIAEDSGWTTHDSNLTLAGNGRCFDTNAGDTLTFTIITENTSEVDCNILNSHVLRVNPALNWNGVTSCTVRCSDGELTADDSFSITVTSTNDPPVIGNVSLVSTTGNDKTTDNLTVSFDSSDEDGDVVTNVTDWRKSGTSIAVLNMPFDTNVSSTTTDAVKDYSSYSNDGTLGGGTSSKAPTWTSSGKVGGAYSFDGSDDYVEVSHHTSLTSSTNLTVSAWINANEWETNSWEGVIVAKNDWASGSNGYALRTGDSGKLSFNIGDGTGSWFDSVTTSIMSVDTWYHVVGVFNGTACITYINGIERDVESFSSRTINPSNYDLNIGRGNYDTGNRLFKGSIDEVKLYNYSLSAEQITAIYNAENAGYKTKTTVSQETTKDDVWTVQVTPNDATEDGTAVTSNSITILNTIPTQPVLDYPENGDGLFTNRTPKFNWTASSDVDDDTLTYQFQLSLNSQFSSLVKNTESIANNYYEYPEQLDFNKYYWRVRAYDGEEYSSWSTTFDFTVVSNLDITMTVTTLDFGTVNINDQNDTTNDDPLPFTFENSGNDYARLANVTVSTPEKLWSTRNLNTNFWRVKARSASSFNTGSSQTTFINVQTNIIDLVRQFNHTDSNDDLNVDIDITVPPAEPAATRIGQMTFYWETEP